MSDDRRVGGQLGALSPGFLMFLVAAATGIFFLLQLGHANVLATESRTAADAAALAGAEHLRFRLDDLSVGSTVGALDRDGACRAAADYADRNGARVVECRLDGDSLLRPQYAVMVVVEGLDGPVEGPSDSIGDQRPRARARAEVELVLDSPGSSDPLGWAFGHPIVGSDPVLAPWDGSERWHAAGGWGAWMDRLAGGIPSTGLPSAEGYAWPICAPVTSEYGPRWGRMHYGIDQGAPTGTPIGAAKAGTVTRVAFDPGGYGHWVEVSHGDGMTTRYGHMSAVGVSVGETVELGDLLGNVGSTGRSTGPHLHFEVRVGGTPVNPRMVLPGSPC